MTKKGGGSLPTIKEFNGTKNELKRATYILTFLRTRSEAEACKASGLSIKAHARIIRMFAARGDAYDGERPGRPVVYTDAIMEAAYETLIDKDSGLLTGHQLKKMLVDEGLLGPTSDDKVFMQHLRQYIMSQGHRLITNSVKTTFFLKLSDVVDRYKYGNEMMEVLKTRELASLVFVDEVTLEESPHPKGNLRVTVLLMPAEPGDPPHWGFNGNIMHLGRKPRQVQVGRLPPRPVGQAKCHDPLTPYF